MQTISIQVPSGVVTKRFLVKSAAWILLAYLVYLAREIWLPLGLAVILALVLDPVVDRMEARGWGRGFAAGFIFGSFLLITGGLIFLASPYIFDQASSMQAQYERYFPDSSNAGMLKSFHQMNVSDGAAQVGARAMGSLQAEVKHSMSTLTESGMALASNLVWVVIIPVVAFYTLRDFHIILTKALLVVPTRSRPIVQSAVGEVTDIFGRYLRGLALVSALNGVATFLLLQALGVPSALILGIIAGLLYSVPYVGAVVTVVLTATVAFLGGGIHMLLVSVAGSILLHQIIFDQIITPRVLGAHVGLHPILSIVALLVGNLLFGIIGMILAVPVAACIQIAVLAMLPKLAVDIEMPSPVTQAVQLAAEEPDLIGPTTPVDPTEQMKVTVAGVVDEIEGAL